MLPLRELQLRFFSALTAPDSAVLSPAAPTPAALIALPAAHARARLPLYATTMRSNFEAALRSTYPVIARLVGDEYFAQTAHEFQRLHPSRSGDLGYVGRGFPTYLATLHGGGEFDYLPDVARLEVLIEETLLAADAGPLDLERLAQVPASDYDTLVFHAHPSLRLFESAYPAVRIWETNVASTATPERVDLATGADRVALLRRQLNLEFHRLSVGEYAFLGAIVDGATIAAALERGAEDTEFDPSAALARFVTAGALVGFSLPIDLH